MNMTPETKQAINKFCAEKCGRRIHHPPIPDKEVTYIYDSGYVRNFRAFNIFNPSNPALLEVMDKLNIAVWKHSIHKDVYCAYQGDLLGDKLSNIKIIMDFTYMNTERPIAVALSAGFEGEIG